MKKLVSIIIFITTLGNAIHAQVNEKRLALVIGNAAYQNGGDLKNPVNDANLMSTTLKNLGFQVKELTNATLKQMQDAAIDFTDKISNYDIALFYYAGHGIQVNGANYLLPVDAKLDTELRAKYEAFDISDINYAFSQNSNKMNIMILDACRDNPFRSWMRGGNRGFKAIRNQAAGTIIAFATREGETANDGAGSNGLYTEKLVQQIKKEQSIVEVFQNTRVEVLKATANKQCPQEWNMLTGNFMLKASSGGTENIQQAKETKNPVFKPGNITVHYGSISIDTEIGGDLYIDGEKLGYINANSNNNKLNSISAGNHTIEIKGDENYKETVNVSKDQTAYIAFKSNKPTTHDAMAGQYFVDPRDGKKYKKVKIGQQIWMAENLAYKPSSGNYWAYDNDENNVEKYGYLYDWETAKNACPDGWHLPAKKEFEELLSNYRGGVEQTYFALKKNGANDFSAILGGSNNNGEFKVYGKMGYYWTSSKLDTKYAKRLYLIGYNVNGVGISNDNISKGFSVRCIKN